MKIQYSKTRNISFQFNQLYQMKSNYYSRLLVSLDLLTFLYFMFSVMLKLLMISRHSRLLQDITAKFKICCYAEFSIKSRQIQQSSRSKQYNTI